jgi:hypothetical protein
MTSISDARTALVAAVGASDAAIDPPACYVYGSGSDMAPAGGRGFEWEFRVTCAVAYSADDASASALLAALLASKLTVLWQLAGWRVLRVGPDQVRQIAGGDQFTADIAVTTIIHI